MKKKLIIKNYTAEKIAMQKKICEEFLALGDEYSQYQKVLFLADKYKKTDSGIYYILKKGGIYEPAKQKQEAC